MPQLRAHILFDSQSGRSKMGRKPNGARSMMPTWTISAGLIALLCLGLGGCSKEQAAPIESVAGEPASTDPIQQLRNRADAGDPAAMYELSKRYLLGNGVEEDNEMSGKLLRRAADKQYPDAMVDLAGHILLDAALATNYGSSTATTEAEKRQEARDLYERAARLGGPSAAEALGIFYLTEIDPPDARLAEPWLLSAAESERPRAMVALQRIYSDQIYTGQKSPVASREKASLWKSRMEALTDPKAIGEVGNLIYYGFILSDASWFVAIDEFVPKREWVDEAKPYLLNAARAGNHEAAQLLGRISLNGFDGNRRPQDAARWLSLAADGKDIWSMVTLGRMYVEGTGVPQDYQAAAKLFEAAANRPDFDRRVWEAQYYMGLLTERGLGVQRDPIKAHAWYNIAVTNGYEEAKAARTALTKQLSADELAAAQQLATDWTPGDRRMVAATRDGAAGPAAPTSGGKPIGSGFVVSEDGHVLTNSHVIADCRDVRLSGRASSLKVVAVDPGNDLALLSHNDHFPSVAAFRRSNNLEQGEEVVVYGFPLAGALATSGNASAGSITATAGLMNNSSHVQIDAPIQLGNSGGPLLDSKGQVIGIVFMKLDAAKVAAATGDVPQNVNFAIKHSLIKSFLDANNVSYEIGWPIAFGMSNRQIAETARGFTVLIECWQ